MANDSISPAEGALLRRDDSRSLAVRLCAAIELLYDQSPVGADEEQDRLLGIARQSLAKASSALRQYIILRLKYSERGGE